VERLARIIAHVDMDAFYAAIEVRDHPRYRGFPVVVGAPPSARGVVAAASYEARRYGIRSAMPSREARARCPQAIFLPVDMEKYRAVSAQLFEILETFTPRIEPLSIDEAFLDLTGCPVPGGGARQEASRADGPGAAEDPGLAIGRAIKARIRAALDLPASIGVAPNKFLAKLASELAKPDGLRRIGPEEVQEVLDPLPVTFLWGVGEETRRRLGSMGITTIGALRRAPTSVLRASLGFAAEHLAALSRGIDDRPVEAGARAKSVGREVTFAHDTRDPEILRRTLASLAEEVARGLRGQGLRGQTVTLKVRYGDFRTVTRRATLDAPTDTGQDLYRAAEWMWSRIPERGRAIRLLGVSASRLGRSAQLDLFGGGRRDRADRVMDAINTRFGDGAVRPGRLADAEDPDRSHPAAGVGQGAGSASAVRRR